MPFTCPKCSAEFFDRLKYCPDCGFDFSAAQKRCPKCRSHIHVDSKTCPECGLDFEQWSYFVPRLVVFGSLAILIAIIVVSPWVWKAAPWLHDKASISDGFLRSDIQGQGLVPLFIHWKTGEHYIQISREHGGLDNTLNYMNQLVPLPPAVVFHWDISAGERVWIIRWVHEPGGERWAQVGRWREGPAKYGWVHETNLKVEE